MNDVLTHAAQKSIVLQVAVLLNKCLSENAASLFKSIRVSADYLWWAVFCSVGVGRLFFFPSTKVLSITIR